MPNQGIGTASSRANRSGQRKLRSPNAEPHAPGKDFLPSAAGRRREEYMRKTGRKTLRGQGK